MGNEIKPESTGTPSILSTPEGLNERECMMMGIGMMVACQANGIDPRKGLKQIAEQDMGKEVVLSASSQIARDMMTKIG